jgi:hypothetical protein
VVAIPFAKFLIADDSVADAGEMDAQASDVPEPAKLCSPAPNFGIATAMKNRQYDKSISSNSEKYGIRETSCDRSTNIPGHNWISLWMR